MQRSGVVGGPDAGEGASRVINVRDVMPAEERRLNAAVVNPVPVSL